MKKILTVALAGTAIALMTGCAGVVTGNGGVAPAAMGPNFFSDVSANAILQPVQAKSYTVVKQDVTAESSIKSFFTVVNTGDASYGTLKAKALAQAPGATDLINVKMDYHMKNICGVNEITVKMTATAIKY